ncbi:hypothetical protein LB542_20260 [Mesorhizobium sp. BR1-1-9]|uniref:hypothetical protein n=1 Tax=unclassified Mesorhizobium TaxID=325217 RepID=UPI001CD0D443|nr:MULTISPECIES: hypothetical protein [unclassified Mesorhizobium]MBZ9873182.1 hypothetical protein [Mesorhizobium sp. BR1-1-9]MBZ9945007.1 hypothetical protein [Mesorhizobium sp. BR1-1-13]
MSALLLSALNETATPLTRHSLVRNAANVGGQASAAPVPQLYDERWLRDLLFRHPELMVLERLDAGLGDIVPLCCELPISRIGGTVFADLLGVTRTGRLVVVECKLWRNPQARREVLAQILEYAALLRRWSFGDLTSALKRKLATVEPNPIFAAAKILWPDLEEAPFVDAVTRSLKLGDFQLIVAGDGIRSDMHAIADHLNAQGAGLAQLALLEIQLWQAASGNILVVPTVPLRTEVLQQRVLVDIGGMPLQLEIPEVASALPVDTMENVVDPERSNRRSMNRAFWQQFIDQVRFDHPDQPPPRHGGDNWVRVPLPEPLGWMTAFRSTGTRAEVGLFLTFRDQDGQTLFDDLQVDIEQLRNESGLDLVARLKTAAPFYAELGVFRARSEFTTDEQQLDWLCDAANRFVSLIRPRLSVLVEAAE